MFTNHSYENVVVVQTIPHLTTVCTCTFLSSTWDWLLLETKISCKWTM